jgi:hypothetical protein
MSKRKINFMPVKIPVVGWMKAATVLEHVCPGETNSNPSQDMIMFYCNIFGNLKPLRSR